MHSYTLSHHCADSNSTVLASFHIVLHSRGSQPFPFWGPLKGSESLFTAWFQELWWHTQLDGRTTLVFATINQYEWFFIHRTDLVQPVRAPLVSLTDIHKLEILLWLYRLPLFYGECLSSVPQERILHAHPHPLLWPRLYQELLPISSSIWAYQVRANTSLQIQCIARLVPLRFIWTKKELRVEYSMCRKDTSLIVWWWCAWFSI